MSYNPNNPPIGGNAGQEYWDLGRDAPDVLAKIDRAPLPASETFFDESGRRTGYVIRNADGSTKHLAELGEGTLLFVDNFGDDDRL